MSSEMSSVVVEVVDSSEQEKNGHKQMEHRKQRDDKVEEGKKERKNCSSHQVKRIACEKLKVGK